MRDSRTFPSIRNIEQSVRNIEAWRAAMTDSRLSTQVPNTPTTERAGQ